jgi:hypothetical protein
MKNLVLHPDVCSSISEIFPFFCRSFVLGPRRPRLSAGVWTSSAAQIWFSSICAADFSRSRSKGYGKLSCTCPPPGVCGRFSSSDFLPGPRFFPAKSLLFAAEADFKSRLIFFCTAQDPGLSCHRPPRARSRFGLCNEFIAEGFSYRWFSCSLCVAMPWIRLPPLAPGLMRAQGLPHLGPSLSSCCRKSGRCQSSWPSPVLALFGWVRVSVR